MRRKVKKVFTENEAIAMMHTNTANALREIVAHIKKNEHNIEDVCDLLIETADLLGAQAMVVDLRDTL